MSSLNNLIFVVKTDGEEKEREEMIQNISVIHLPYSCFCFRDNGLAKNSLVIVTRQ